MHSCSEGLTNLSHQTQVAPIEYQNLAFTAKEQHFIVSCL